MAGDLELHERVLVHPERLPAAAESAATVTTLSGGVTHEYGPRVVIAALPPSAEPVVRAQMPEVAMEAAPAALPDELTTDLDEVGALGLAAFAMRESAAYAKAKAKRKWDGEDWGEADADAPDAHEGSLAESLAAE